MLIIDQQDGLEYGGKFFTDSGQWPVVCAAVYGIYSHGSKRPEVAIMGLFYGVDILPAMGFQRQQHLLLLLVYEIFQAQSSHLFLAPVATRVLRRHKAERA